jgi:hypothetical protein
LGVMASLSCLNYMVSLRRGDAESGCKSQG